MLPLGHMGIGRRLVARWTGSMPLWAVLLGTLLPDLIDKPIYCLASLITGRHGIELGLLSGTRTFGHTLLLTLIVLGIGAARRSPVLLGIGLGMLTHVGLDTAADFLNARFDPLAAVGPIPGTAATFWPLLGFQFPVAMSSTLGRYAHHSLTKVNLAGEIVGAILLLLEWRRLKRPAAGVVRQP